MAAVPFIFSNGTIADANQVNANFAALQSGLSEYVQALGYGIVVGSNSAVGTMTSVLTMPLPVGDWEVRGWAHPKFNPRPFAPITWLGCYLSTSTGPGAWAQGMWYGGSIDIDLVANTQEITVTPGPVTLNTATPVTVHMNVGMTAPYPDNAANSVIATMDVMIAARRHGDYRPTSAAEELMVQQHADQYLAEHFADSIRVSR